ncbi:Fructosamine kinase-domain-containing protein [Apiospora marii]|uniref:protein-ribulosamine 3-kinase n=1 Tax=Apiospora marii TaxID=335849 RepID=A0ABR1RLM7_9PEZI
MQDEPIDPERLARRVAELHNKGVAADGLYGADEVIAGGVLPVRPARSNSWVDDFFRYMRVLIRLEQIAQGPPPAELARLLDAMFNRIIPRLLRPLETGGREIMPRLTHTDLWHGNMATGSDGNPVIFDPACIYGHNEMEIGVWANPRMVAGMPLINSYHEFFAKSAPAEDFTGRNTLYALAFETRVSATVLGNGFFRQELIRYLTDLDNNLPESYEEWAQARGEEICPPKADSGMHWP